MMGRRQEIKSGAEQDVLHARNWYCYLKRSGVCKAIKKAMNRRARQEAKHAMRRE